MVNKAWSGAWIVAFAAACSAPEPQGMPLPSTDGGNAGSRASGTANSGGSSGKDSGSGRSGSGPRAGAGSEPESAATEVTVSSPNLAAEAALNATLAQVDGIDAAGLRERYPTRFVESLGYAPGEAVGLDKLQASPLALTTAELALLGTNGFVITDRQSFPSFVDGYTAIYGEHLPLYVSADSLLNATHRSYDKILQRLEEVVMIPRLGELLATLRSALAAGAASEFGTTAVADADVYLAVAASLLGGTLAAPSAGGSSGEIAYLYERALAAEGSEETSLFGVSREVDFSQFEPRGHYVGEGFGAPSADDPPLERYFRSMMWLGLMDLRLIETLPGGSRVFRRRQLELAYALRSLYDSAALEKHATIDSIVRAFVGESDNMTLGQLDALLADLSLTTPAGLATKSDQEIAQAILDGGYGQQQISGHILRNGTDHTLPLSATFMLLGRRYVIDSHVFSNVVWDRVFREGAPYRMMPNPLDVAFAALSNNQAGALLESELTTYAYAPELAKTRTLVDSHPQEFWGANLYNGWLDALRSLSPPADLSEPAALGLPAVAATEAFGRRILNTQLASWAELRHDTVLYAKQSYTGAPSCEFPDGYVDPYPEFYAKLRGYAERGRELVSGFGIDDERAGAPVFAYFDHLATVASQLEGMAEHQRSGTPFTPEQIEFLNGAVSDSGSCFFDPDGWYPGLVFGGLGGDADTEFDPPIADVHTQPTDEGGNPIGRVLHVATGLARLMVVTTNTCSGPRAYVGLASSYFERVTENYERLKDEAWAAEVMGTAPADVPWMQDLVAR